MVLVGDMLIKHVENNLQDLCAGFSKTGARVENASGD